MEGKRQSRKDERHDDIMKEYDIVIKQLSDIPPFGNLATQVSKSFIYDVIAERLHYSLDHVCNVIKRRLRKKGR